MVKNATITVRVDADTKARIEAAAGRLGKSLTTFVLEAAEKAAGKVETMNAIIRKPKGRGACPTFFLALCHEAKQGGEQGYRIAGRQLAGALASLGPWDMDEEEWHSELSRLEALLTLKSAKKAMDAAAALEWFDRNLPRCMELIPRRRRDQFLSGICDKLEQDGILY